MQGTSSPENRLASQKKKKDCAPWSKKVADEHTQICSDARSVFLLICAAGIMKDDHPLYSRVEVRNSWSCTFTPQYDVVLKFHLTNVMLLPFLIITHT